MPEFHSVEDKINVIAKFKDERLQYFGKKFIYMEKPEVLSKEDYDLIHKDTAKKLLAQTMKNGILYQELTQRLIL